MYYNDYLIRLTIRGNTGSWMRHKICQRMKSWCPLWISCSHPFLSHNDFDVAERTSRSEANEDRRMSGCTAEEMFAWLGAILVNAGFLSLVTWGATSAWTLGTALCALYGKTKRGDCRSSLYFSRLNALFRTYQLPFSSGWRGR
jgi:hypothetical protein